MQIRRMERTALNKHGTSGKSARPSASSRRLIALVANRKLLLACSLLFVLLAVGLVKLVGSTTTQAGESVTEASASTTSTAQMSSSPSATTVAATTTTSETVQSRTPKMKLKRNKLTAAESTMSKGAPSQAQPSMKKCDYDKGEWQDCQSNGLQQKVMRLKAGDRTQCKAEKTIRRDCTKTGEVGCKYARGEWSNVCQDGKRVRIDTLVGLVGGLGGNEGQQKPPAASLATRCKPQRRVTKDCGQTCHYVKSAWSECSPDGFKTRLLTLDETHKQDAPAVQPPAGTSTTPTAAAANVDGDGDNELPEKGTALGKAGVLVSKQRPKRTPADNQICARQKLIRRECRPGPKLAPGQVQQQPAAAANNAQIGASAGSNMKQIQRRRLKQIQLKQTSTAPRSTTGGGGSQTKSSR